MKRNIILFAIAMIAVIAFAGSAQASVTVDGDVNSTVAEGEIVTLWLDENSIDYVTEPVRDATPDYYYFDDISSLLGRNGYSSGNTNIPVTIAMYCSGTTRDIDGVSGSSYTNTYRNVTVLHITVDYTDDSFYPPVMNLTTCTTPDPDLIVASITANCGGYLFGNQSNTISAMIENIDAGNAPASHASFVLSDGYSKTVAVPAILAGENTTVSITDPTIRAKDDSVTITVTADSDAEVSESNETNNASVQSETVVNNGYKGKTYTGGSNMTTWKTYDLNGNLVYSAGDSWYQGCSASYGGDPDWTDYDVSWTAGDLPVSGTVKEARLYVMYTWAKYGVVNITGNGMTQPYISVEFNGNPTTLDAHYWDEKMFSTSYPYGMLVYNVTDNFNAGGNIANLTNSYPGGDNVSMRGMELVVIYEDDTEPHRQIYINEEFDLLYGGSYMCTTPEEATAWAPITGPAIDISDVAGARLITFAPGADGSGTTGEGELIFNGEVWNNEWTDNEVHQIGVSDRDVTSHLDSTDNLVGFQSNADWMEVSNAFLVVEYKKIPAGVTFDKKKINLNSNGILKAFITLPVGYDVADIDVSTVTCEGADVFGDGSVIPGKNALEVKFKIPDLMVVPAEDMVELTVTGKLTDCTVFEASNTVEVIDKS